MEPLRPTPVCHRPCRRCRPAAAVNRCGERSLVARPATGDDAERGHQRIASHQGSNRLSALADMRDRRPKLRRPQGGERRSGSPADHQAPIATRLWPCSANPAAWMRRGRIGRNALAPNAFRPGGIQRYSSSRPTRSKTTSARSHGRSAAWYRSIDRPYAVGLSYSWRNSKSFHSLRFLEDIRFKYTRRTAWAGDSLNYKPNNRPCHWSC